MLEFTIIPIGAPIVAADMLAIDKGARDGKQVLQSMRAEIEARAQELAPLGATGNLRASIHCVPTSDGIKLYSDPDVADYAYWVEYGHRNKWTGKWTPGKFFMTQTIAEYTEGATRITPTSGVGIIGGEIVKEIEEKRKAAKVSAAASGMSLGLSALGGLFGFLSFAMLGYSGLMAMAR